ncbi:hypothetical protein EST38_g6369 [Candolleomyces aberdarensis]|uniref:Uncharacterized protein n=1 Tax=Candolleomyces aberdarensis TaxID=2316362 RepID=A0A4Q2DL43_9AGAR|nr:hypothetical protein EST38_g6369 [Candolleomyces aberdarensis]
MGEPEDRLVRIETARLDDQSKQNAVKSARHLIYKNNLAVTNNRVEDLLSEGSLLPIDNAFSARLAKFSFNMFSMLVVDLMHEVDLGVWKSLFIQLLRLLEATDKGLLTILDVRYRSMPTFGADTIRRFTSNASEMKQLAARDFEDLLQCAIPAFEGLLPEPHNGQVISLLYVLAKWHSLAKLRIHTDHTVNLLDEMTTALGSQFRLFEKGICLAIKTKELPREYQARKRREARRKATVAQKNGNKRRKLNPSHTLPTESSELPTPEAPELEQGNDPGLSSGRKEKSFNLKTYKFHSLGDVAACIRTFGTTDSYSTQTPEGLHRCPKSHYKRTSKKNVSRQLSRIQMRQMRIQRLRKQLYPASDEGFSEDCEHEAHYFIGKSQNQPICLPEFLRTKRDDPVTKDFMSKLRAHLLPRILQQLLQEAENPNAPAESTYNVTLLRSLVQAHNLPTDQMDTTLQKSDMDRILIHSDRIYNHNIFHINYTRYDVRRDVDIINPKTSRRDLMCLRELEKEELADVAHRFVYSRVLGIYHVNIIYRGRGAFDLRKRRFDFLWIRRYQALDSTSSADSLDRLELIPLANKDAVGFLDPAHVLRSCHIIPRFSLGQRYFGAHTSRIASKLAKDQDDWKEYYANRFVDRDMSMRYLWGLGIGHRYAHSDAPKVKPAPIQRSPTPACALPLPEHPTSSGNAKQQAEALADAVLQSHFVEDPSPDLEPASQEHEYALEDVEREDQDWYSDEEEENIGHRVQEPESEPDD